MQFIIRKKENIEDQYHTAAIIGAGPAGITASIYLGRAKIDTVVFERMIPGGYIVATDKIENYPGFPDGISGEELGNLMEKHLKRFDAQVKTEEVTNVELDTYPMKIITEEGSYSAEAIIIATGTKNKRLGVPGEDELVGKGISFCAICDAPFFEGENIVVIGAGNSGVQEALYLSKFAKSIKVLEFLDHPTAEGILLDRLKEKDNLELLVSQRVTSFIGKDRLTGVEVEEKTSKKKKVLKVRGAFIYAGLSPNTDFLKGKLDLNKEGFIKTDEELRTSKEGVFAAGDVRTTSLHQVATAIGDGALAAHNLREYIEEK